MLKIIKIFTKYCFIYPLLQIVNLIDLISHFLHKLKFKKTTDIVINQLTDKNDPRSPYRSSLVTDIETIDDIDLNLFDEFSSSAKKYWNNKSLGSREVFNVANEIQPDGKILKKYSLGKYKWITYEEMYNKIVNLSNGLLDLGLRSNDNMILFCETRPQWLISAFACFKIKVPVVTLYSTLGIEALEFGINQTKASFLITSVEQLPKILDILNKTQLTNIIVITENHNENQYERLLSSKEKSNVSFFTFKNVIDIGRNLSLDSSKSIPHYEKPKKDDLAVIMYTSGSTGTPKGVMITHGNILSASRALTKQMIDVENNLNMAFLPLAHVFEMIAELFYLERGKSIGYSSSETLTDFSLGINKGDKGDLRELNPILIPVVPLVLERFSKAIKDKFNSASFIAKTIFEIAYDQKLHKIKTNKSTSLLDIIIFNKIKDAVVGNKLKLIICGGSLLSKEVHEFTEVCFSPIIQVYGSTEIICCSTQSISNREIGTVGTLISSCEIKLVEWEEGGYWPTDKPNPRGEIYIGGPTVASGYYQMPEKTKEDFQIINGVRYFASGDIGEMCNGNLKLIDRKKDLVKLSGGEYVSLNKVETILKLLPFVDNCCVIVNSTKSFCVCLICPNINKMKELLFEIESCKEELLKLETINDIQGKMKQIIKLIDETNGFKNNITKKIISHCFEKKLSRFEIPTKVKFVAESWLPELGFVTASFKIKRHFLENFYKNDIQILYSS